MTDQTKLGIVILAAALVVGVSGDIWLRTTPWGLNLFVWTAALVLTLILIVRWRRVAFNGSGRWLVVPILFFAGALAWRDSTVLKGLYLLALSLSLSLALLRAQAGQILLAGVMEYALSVAIAAFNAISGAVRLIADDIGWEEIPADGWARHAKSIVRGLALALPLLLIFGGLLAGADAAFSKILVELFDWDFAGIVKHSLVIFCLTWMVGGFFRGVLLGKEFAVAAGERPPFLSLGITELGIVLGLLDTLFFGFVFVQFKYFFGGAERVQTVAGLTYAEYARSGFFELVTVAVLVLPLLLAAHWLLRKENPNAEKIFRSLAGIQVVLLIVIMISALQRMRLYQREYGLTELRVYTTAFMGWLGIVFVWFSATVLRGKRERFAFGAVATGFLVIIALLVVNPDRLIVRANLERAGAGRSFDAEYAASLSADAAPELIASAHLLDQQARCVVATRMQQRKPYWATAGWRRWNWSRARAVSVIEANGSALRAACEK